MRKELSEIKNKRSSEKKIVNITCHSIKRIVEPVTPETKTERREKSQEKTKKKEFESANKVTPIKFDKLTP